MKIETPEEFTQRIESAIVPKYAKAPNGRGGLVTISKDYTWAAKLIAARDAAIRAESAELLRVCGEALKAAQSIKSLVQSIERGEDWEGGEPSLGTCRSLGRIKSISDEATTALAALKDAGCVNKTLKNEQEKNDA